VISLPRKIAGRDLVVRRFMEQDREGIRGIYKDFFEEVPTQFLDEEGFFVSLLGDEVVGFVLVPYFDQPPYFEEQHFGGDVKSYCFLEELHVHHEYQHQGIGTALTKKAIRYARSRKADAIYTMEDNYNVIARKTYEKCGFQEHSGITRFILPLH